MHHMQIDPVTVQEALCGDNKVQWQAAMADEMKSRIMINDTWELVSLPTKEPTLKTVGF